MSKYLRYLWYVLRHKWFVFVECCKFGIPLRGVFHDWTKFLPVEWFPYVHYFYGEWRNGNQDRQAIAPPSIQEAFERAWNHHQKRNDHHWQYWVRLGDDGTTLILDMPERCRREMLADWRGAGRALGKPDTLAWYAANYKNQKLHTNVRLWLEEQLAPIFDIYCQPHTDGRQGDTIRVDTILAWDGGSPAYELGDNDVPMTCGADVKAGHLCGVSAAGLVYPTGEGHFYNGPEWRPVLRIGGDA